MTVLRAAPHVDDLLRTLAPQVVGVLARRSGDFCAAEDAVQEALLAAAVQWPEQGLPDHPRAWLLRVLALQAVGIDPERIPEVDPKLLCPIGRSRSTTGTFGG